MKSLKWTNAEGRQIEFRAHCNIGLRAEVAYADGWTVETGRMEKVVDAKLELWIDGKQARECRGTHGWNLVDAGNGRKMLQGLNITLDTVHAEKVEQWLNELIEAGKTDEYRAWETAKAKAKAEAAKVEAEDQKRRHPGYCPKCESYCYGDCEANK